MDGVFLPIQDALLDLTFLEVHVGWTVLFLNFRDILEMMPL